MKQKYQEHIDTCKDSMHQLSKQLDLENAVNFHDELLSKANSVMTKFNNTLNRLSLESDKVEKLEEFIEEAVKEDITVVVDEYTVKSVACNMEDLTLEELEVAIKDLILEKHKRVDALDGWENDILFICPCGCGSLIPTGTDSNEGLLDVCENCEQPICVCVDMEEFLDEEDCNEVEEEEQVKYNIIYDDADGKELIKEVVYDTLQEMAVTHSEGHSYNQVADEVEAETQESYLLRMINEELTKVLDEHAKKQRQREFQAMVDSHKLGMG